MKIKKTPGFLRKLFITTAEDYKIPVDEKLDGDILTLKNYMKHVYPLTLSIIYRKTINTLRYKWQILLRKTFHFFVLIALIYTSYQLYGKDVVYEHKEKIMIERIFIEHSSIPKENLEFLHAIALLESNGNYNIIGGFNNAYWGAYQMGVPSRKDVGLGDMEPKTFLGNEVIQDWAMNEYMKINYSRLKKYIDKYKIPYKGGVRIGHNLVTVSGLIAAAHLGGSQNVINFLESNGKVVFKDGNGVPITHYFQLNNYPLYFE